MKQYQDGMSMSLSLETPERTNDEKDMIDSAVRINTSNVGRLRIRFDPKDGVMPLANDHGHQLCEAHST